MRRLAAIHQDEGLGALGADPQGFQIIDLTDAVAAAGSQNEPRAARADAGKSASSSCRSATLISTGL